MNTDLQHFQNLLKRYADHQISKEDYDLLLAYIGEHGLNAELEDVMDKDWETLSMEFPFAELKSEGLYQKISASVSFGIPAKSNAIKLWFNLLQITGIAAAIAAIAVGVWFFSFPGHSGEDMSPSDASYANDIAPGSIGATLTLSDGKTIKLSEAKNGDLAIEAGVTISKSANGQITYKIIGSTHGGNTVNTLSTAKGETYDLLLPDGTLVSLNAASSLSYPSSFAHTKERRVKLKGEGYFKVAKDKAHPFIVKTANQEVQVLGTHFNITAYEDDRSTKTTLIEGAVRLTSIAPFEHAGAKVENRVKTEILKPNEQAVLNNGAFRIAQVDAQDAIAWKQGYFAFNNETLEEIMNRVERWYNVSVVFEDSTLKKETFIGSVSKYGHVSKVLKFLAGTNTITFKIEGKTIRVGRK